MDRRKLLNRMGLVAGGMITNRLCNLQVEEGLHELNAKHLSRPEDEVVKDPSYWKEIKKYYVETSNILNLNNGGVSPQPIVVQEATEKHYRRCNDAPSYYMWRILDKGREPLRQKLAALGNSDAEEIAINRNSSEALETIIFGLNLKKGDEVVVAIQDYPNMKNAWIQRERRDGIVLRWLDLDLPSEDIDYFVDSYVNACNAKTKVVQLTHVVNWTGQKLPVSHIARRVKESYDVDIIVDGAHSFCHFQFDIPDLHCDYFGTSLHKWLGAPFGTGMLYVKKDKIRDVWPLLAAPKSQDTDIRKFENLGTRSFAIEQGINEAIEFQDMIGRSRKEQRLFYLKNYWAEKVKDWDRFSIGTPLSKEFSGALALLQIEGYKPNKLVNDLHTKYNIHTTNVKLGKLKGIRITPNVYTLETELDYLVEALDELRKS